MQNTGNMMGLPKSQIRLGVSIVASQGYVSVASVSGGYPMTGLALGTSYTIPRGSPIVLGMSNGDPNIALVLGSSSAYCPAPR